jgi:hypothetical protein
MMDIVSRVQAILMKPKEEWKTIKEESTTVSQLFTSYAMVVAAIPALSQFIGLAIIGQHIPFRGMVRYGFGTAFFYAIFSYVATLLAAYILGIVINALAPTFSSKQDQVSAMKLSVYSMTAAWVAGILHLIPLLRMLAWVGFLYGLYILYLGFSAELMETPKDKVLTYFVVSFVVALAVTIVLNLILGAIFLVGAVSSV